MAERGVGSLGTDGYVGFGLVLSFVGASGETFAVGDHVDIDTSADWQVKLATNGGRFGGKVLAVNDDGTLAVMVTFHTVMRLDIKTTTSVVRGSDVFNEDKTGVKDGNDTGDGFILAADLTNKFADVAFGASTAKNP